MAHSQGRAGRPYRRLCATVYAEEDYCWLCHRLVDKALPWPHRLSKSVDHVIPLIKGGPPLARWNARLAHLGCNSSKGAKLPSTTRALPAPSRDW